MIKPYYSLLTLSLICLSLGGCYSRFFLSSEVTASVPPATMMSRLPDNQLRSGDLIFRSGTGVAGQLLAEADPDTSYSHVGLVVIQQGVPFVIHASLTGEKGKGKVILDSLEDFLRRDAATEVAVYRLPSELAHLPPKAVKVAQHYVQEEIPFDASFDLSDAERLYCTELVWRAYREAGFDLVEGEFDTLSLPFTENNQYILPSRILNSSQLKPIVFITN